MMAYCRETRNPKSWLSPNIIEAKRKNVQGDKA